MADHHHEEDVRNPDYEGPTQHCLPPEVHEGVGKGVVFAILMVLLALGAAAMGKALLG
jgi:hypothetical protein